MIKSSFYVMLTLLLLNDLGANCCLQEERATLLQIKAYFNSMINSSSNSPDLLPSWVLPHRGDENCCLWDRVTCDPSTRHVIRLYLNENVPDDQPPWPLNLTVFRPLQQLISISLSENSIGSLVAGFQGTCTFLAFM